MATALAPEIGYDKAADLSKEAYKTIRERTDLSEDLLDVRKMTKI